VISNTVPTSIDDFETALLQEFVPFDSVQRSKDKLRKHFQKGSVSSYLSQFRNISILIPNMNEGEQVDRFCQGLKPQIRLEVMKAGVQTMTEASKIALNVDSALFNSRKFYASSYSGNSGPVPTPMEIGNMEQRRQDMEKNSCFKCHKVGCRPWKCKKRSAVNPSVNHTDVEPKN